MSTGRNGPSYTKILVGHSKCDWSRWVWKRDFPPEGGSVRVLDDQWICPVCNMFGCLVGPDNDSQLAAHFVPQGVMWVADERPEL